MEDIRSIRVEPPLDATLADQLLAVWEWIFQTPYDWLAPILAGSERGVNRHVLFLAMDGDTIAGTSHLVTPVHDARVGGLGEVATMPDYRGRGVAHHLSAAARDEFIQCGGKALLLGTANPAAEAIYQRLGWRRVPGSQVMCLCADHHTPEEFLTDYYHERTAWTVQPGNAAHRIPMIPLILSSHSDCLLDANRGIYATRYAVQRSCMGLYPGYERLGRASGAWFAASADDGRAIGLATATRCGDGWVNVDAFCHHRFLAAHAPLLDAVLAWASDRAATRVTARVAAADADKLRRFKLHGFHVLGPGEPAGLDAAPLPTVELERGLV